MINSNPNKHHCCCIKRYMMLNHLCLLFLPNISLVIWTARLWMQPISDWVEYCLILKVFLIKFHLYFWGNSQNIFSVFLNFPLKYAYTLPYPPFRKYIFYRIFFVCSCDIARKCLLEFCFICLSYLLQLGLHLSPTRCLLVYTELFAWPDVKSSKLL